MSKVGAELSFTFRIGPTDKNQFAKVRMEVSEIDTDMPLKEQMEKVDNAFKQIVAYIHKQIDAEVEKIFEEGK